MNAATLALILFVSYASGASYYQQRRMTLSKRTVKPTTCSIQKLHEAVDGRIPSTITCRGVDMGSSNDDTISRVAVGVQCTYTYFCPNDNNASAAPMTGEATCNETGTWIGERPLCHPHEQFMQLIYTSYLNYMLQIHFTNQNVNGTDNIETFFESQNLKKTLQNNNTKSNNASISVKKRCHEKEICKRIKSPDQCPTIVRTRKNKQKQLKELAFCRFCRIFVCKTSVSLI